MRPATRVAARLFAEYGLVRVVQRAGELWVEITPTGQAIVDASSTIGLPLTLGEANPSSPLRTNWSPEIVLTLGADYVVETGYEAPGVR